MKEEYTEEKIKARYEEFGGILRHVLPISVSKLKQVKQERDEKIDTANAQQLLAYKGNIELPDVSHLIMQYKVEVDGPEAFTEKVQDFVSPLIVELLQSKINAVSLEERVITLIRNDEVNSYMETGCPKIYESVIADYLTTGIGVQWQRRDKSKKKGDWEIFNLKLNKKQIGIVPEYDKMETKTLYYSMNPTFPIFEMLYKDGEILVGIQVTRNKEHKRIVKESTIKTFLKKMNISDMTKVKFVLCPLPALADKVELEIIDSNKNHLEYTFPYELWRLPTQYTRSFE